MDEKILEKAIYGIVFIVLLFQLYASLVPVAQASGNQLQQSGVPLGQLFVGNGIVFTIVMAALIILVVRYFLHKGNK